MSYPQPFVSLPTIPSHSLDPGTGFALAAKSRISSVYPTLPKEVQVLKQSHPSHWERRQRRKSHRRRKAEAQPLTFWIPPRLRLRIIRKKPSQQQPRPRILQSQPDPRPATLDHHYYWTPRFVCSLCWRLHCFLGGSPKTNHRFPLSSPLSLFM